MIESPNDMTETPFWLIDPHFEPDDVIETALRFQGRVTGPAVPQRQSYVPGAALMRLRR